MKKELLIRAIVKNFPLCEIVTKDIQRDGESVEGIFVFQNAESKDNNEVAPVLCPSEMPEVNTEEEFEDFTEKVKRTLLYAWNNFVSGNRIEKAINMVLVPKCDDNVPCRDFFNMKIVYYIDSFGENNELISSELIDNQIMKSHGLTEDLLYQIGSQNIRINSFIQQFSDFGENMFVVTNRFLYHGAAVLTDNEILAEIHNKIGDYYIIPSSIHEIMVMKKLDEYGKEFVENTKFMIRAINNDIVGPKDILSEELFEYDGTLKVAS